ncbi:NAD(P)H-binding protein [Brevibacillus sp. 179-C9.3 HS]|uniref:NAD(P)H-binding protein n=1 Tax=unclassified Brevibacillus TaxID=2684853 RepID=UPI0039A3E878
MKRAVLFGATGLVGSELLRLLLEDEAYGQIIAVVRSELSIVHPRLQTVVMDFHQLGDCRVFLEGADVFCCLGTTMKKAGSREAFRKVDYQYPLEIARLAKEEGASQFLIITAIGANSRSVFFYNRVKGELEEALHELKLSCLHIFRPSLLLGPRQENRRSEELGAKLSQSLSFLWIGPLRAYQPVTAADVAGAMHYIASLGLRDTHEHESRDLSQLAAARKKTS